MNGGESSAAQEDAVRPPRKKNNKGKEPMRASRETVPVGDVRSFR